MSIYPVHQIFQFCAYLLSYPEQEFYTSLEEVSEALDDLPNANLKDELHQFCATAKKLAPAELTATYINTFDFGKKTNLYVTYMTNGEQRERGMELLFLKNYYQTHGFEVTDRELPDFLPIMLEFASQVDAETLKPIFVKYLPNIQEVAAHLQREKNVYAHLLKAVLLALETVGLTKQ